MYHLHRGFHNVLTFRHLIIFPFLSHFVSSATRERVLVIGDIEVGDLKSILPSDVSRSRFTMSSMSDIKASFQCCSCMKRSWFSTTMMSRNSDRARSLLIASTASFTGRVEPSGRAMGALLGPRTATLLERCCDARSLRSS